MDKKKYTAIILSAGTGSRMKSNMPKPVSYTHLDVYKRQYKGSQGVISLLFAVLLAAAAVLSAQKGNTEYVVLYIICLLYTSRCV